MIERFLDPLLAPIRQAFGRVLGVKAQVGNVKMDAARLKLEAGMAKEKATAAKQRALGAKDQAGKATAGVGAAQGAMAAKKDQAKKMGFFSFKKQRTCPTCGQVMHPSWPACPTCSRKPGGGKQKTMAIDLSAQGGSASEILGWLVPLEGPQTGQLFSLRGTMLIGTAAELCQVVIADTYMSSRHAEIRAEGERWILTDLGSTNGTFINDKRLSGEQELVDSDNVKFGRTQVKFKCL